MAEKQITISYGTLKLQALEFYMEAEGHKVEDALKEELERLYQKNVPKQVREFLEKGPLEAENRQEIQEQQVQESATLNSTRASRETGSTTGRTSTSAGRNSRNSQRQSTQETEQAQTQSPSTEEEQEQSEVISLSM